jgi:hypothetical protein
MKKIKHKACNNNQVYEYKNLDKIKIVFRILFN